MLVVSTLVAACTAPRPLPIQQLGTEGALVFNGYSAGKVRCYACHGAAGDGSCRGTDLRVEVPSLNDGFIWDEIQYGDGAMPAFGDVLSAREIESIVKWMRDGFPVRPALWRAGPIGPPPPIALPEAGREPRTVTPR